MHFVPAALCFPVPFQFKCVVQLCPSAMPYCDHHGWGWEPGKGPSSCVGETLSFWLALGVLFSSVRTEQGSGLHTVQYPAGSGAAARVHSAQITLSIAQSIIALTGGILSARPRGMLCGALVLHSLGWTLAWLASAAALQRNPRFARCLLWWWLGGAASNRCESMLCLVTLSREFHICRYVN